MYVTESLNCTAVIDIVFQLYILQLKTNKTSLRFKEQ